MTKSAMNDLRKIALSSPAGFLAVGFGAGLSPVAPGTMGTIVAIPLALLLQPFPLAVKLTLVAVLFVAGIYLCGQTSRRLGVHDHGGIVWDEIVGFMLCTLAAPATLMGYLLAFGLFRVFDIFKPWPISLADQKLHGGFGIMADDIIAAIYTAVILILLQLGNII
jgi:phosphatidylglycerophosphatase A